jgi:hypothetical protein
MELPVRLAHLALLEELALSLVPAPWAALNSEPLLSKELAEHSLAPPPWEELAASSMEKPQVRALLELVNLLLAASEVAPNSVQAALGVLSSVHPLWVALSLEPAQWVAPSSVLALWEEPVALCSEGPPSLELSEAVAPTPLPEAFQLVVVWALEAEPLAQEIPTPTFRST